MNMREVGERLVVLQNKYTEASSRVKTLLPAVEAAKEDLDLCLLNQRFTQEAAQFTLETISVRINAMVTKTLAAVLKDPYEFCLDFKIAYGQVACSMFLERDGFIYNLKKQNGDGVVDLVALALRAAVIVLDRRKFRRLMILDEPAGAVSVNYQPLVGRLLEHLSEKLSMQIIMIAAHGSNMDFEHAKCINFNTIEQGDTV